MVLNKVLQINYIGLAIDPFLGRRGARGAGAARTALGHRRRRRGARGAGGDGVTHPQNVILDK